MFQSSDIRLRVKVSTKKKKEELINVKTFHVGKARISFNFFVLVVSVYTFITTCSQHVTLIPSQSLIEKRNKSPIQEQSNHLKNNYIFYSALNISQYILFLLFDNYYRSHS